MGDGDCAKTLACLLHPQARVICSRDATRRLDVAESRHRSRAVIAGCSGCEQLEPATFTPVWLR